VLPSVASAEVKRAVLFFCVVALLVPAVAAAHATLLRSIPANGAVLARAPKAVRVEFDDTIRVASGNAAVANDSSASVLPGKPQVTGHTLVLPLAKSLRDGAYSVRWSIVSDDGHREQGVLAFAVGAGSASPSSVLGASTPLTWSDITLRTLYYLGLLAAGGASVFWLLTRRLAGDRARASLAHLLFFALLATFLGGSAILHGAPPGTRYALVLKIAVTVALFAGAAAALAPTIAWLLAFAVAGSLALLAAPTLSGHALDHSQPRWFSVPVDLAHLAGAAVWIGGLLALVFVVPRAPDGETRRAMVLRFSSAALVAVIVIGLTGLGRALTELSHVSQVWSTSYGRLLIVKTLLFVPLLGLGWLNRTVLIGAFTRLRRSAIFELVLLGAIVVAVAVLTELRPGREVRRASVEAAIAAARPPALPTRDAVVDAHELGSLAVGLARLPGRVEVTLLGPDGTGVDGRRVAVNGRAATRCGAGCYAAPAEAGPVHVSIDGRQLTFTVSERAPDATHLLRVVTRAYRGSKTIVFDERLASSPTNAQTTRFEVVAPNRLSYTTRGGPSAIVIGTRRWDRARPGSPLVESGQSPLDVTQPYWHAPTNAHLVAPGVITFLDRRIPAWFRVTVHGSRPSRMQMTAAAHFMVERYVGFDGPVTISPPPSR
jgi:copper transport protein